jgi:hypothetical protein
LNFQLSVQYNLPPIFTTDQPPLFDGSVFVKKHNKEGQKRNTKRERKKETQQSNMKSSVISHLSDCKIFVFEVTHAVFKSPSHLDSFIVFSSILYRHSCRIPISIISFRTNTSSRQSDWTEDL